MSLIQIFSGLVLLSGVLAGVAFEADDDWSWGYQQEDGRLETCQAEKKACQAARLRDIQYAECPRQLSALISGPRYNIPGNDLTAQGSWHKNHGPQCSRLETPRVAGCYASMWSAPANGQMKNVWIQADLGGIFEVWMIATQGRGYDHHRQWVTSYKLASGMWRNNHGIKFYKNGKVFQANRDQNSVVTHNLRPPMVGRFIRLYPVTYHGHRSLRWELYGRKKSCVTLPRV